MTLAGLGGAGAAVLLLGGWVKDVTHSRSTAESPLLRLGLLLSATGHRACAEGSVLHREKSEIFSQHGCAIHAVWTLRSSHSQRGGLITQGKLDSLAMLSRYCGC